MRKYQKAFLAAVVTGILVNGGLSVTDVYANEKKIVDANSRVVN